MSDSRKQMDPTSLEMLLILKLNSDLWDEKSVNAVFKRSAPQRTERDTCSTPILSSSSSSSTGQSFFSASGNRQQRSKCNDDGNEENDEDQDDEND